jgi:predicted nucleic acid-binding protein
VIVYVETNFLLELALQRDEAKQAQELLKLAEWGDINLVVPAFSLAEARLALQNMSDGRRRFNDSLRVQIDELARSAPYTKLADASAGLTNALISSGDIHAAALDVIANRLRAHAELIPLTGDIDLAMSPLDLALGLETGDAYVYASIVSHIATRPGQRSILATRDRDFDVARAHLNELQCRLFGRFADAVGHLTHATRPE